MTLRIATLALAALLSGTAVAKRPPDLTLCNQAMEAAREGDNAAAADLQQRCIAKAESWDSVFLLYYALGEFRFAASQYAEAVAAYDRAVELRRIPHAALHTRRGRARLELGQVEAARADFEAALAVDPEAKAAHFGLALLLERQDQRDAARASFLRAFNFGERSPEMLRRVREYGFTVPEMPTRQDPPPLPPSAFKKCTPGRTTLKITTDDLGLPVDITVQESSGDAELDRLALEAARKWNLQPAQQDGKYVGGTFIAPVGFANPCK